MSIRSRKNSEEFDEGYEAIFGKDHKPQRGTWVQDAETGEFIEKSLRGNLDPDAPAIHGSPEPFVSPIDGTVISDRAALRRHNQQHGVTNIQDYGENNGKAYFDRKATERQRNIDGSTREAKAQRIETIKENMHRHGFGV